MQGRHSGIRLQPTSSTPMLDSAHPRGFKVNDLDIHKMEFQYPQVQNFRPRVLDFSDSSEGRSIRGSSFASSIRAARF